MLSRSRANQALRLALIAALPLLARESVGGELAYEASLGGGHSDNLTRVAEDAVEETFAAAGLKLSFDEQSKRVDADVVADFDYYDYLDGDYESEFVGNLIGSSRVALVEERLNWTVRDNFGQVLIDPFSPAAPGNRENVNYFNTGLDATFAFGSQTRLNLGAAYAMATYEDSPLDSDTLIGEVSLSRLSSAATSLGLSARVAQVEYSDSTQSLNDFDVSELFGHYVVAGSRTALDAAAGFTEIERADGSSDSGPLVRLTLQRMMSNMSTLRLVAGQEFANSASAFASGQGDSAGIDISPGQQTAAPFKRRYADLTWNASGRRTTLEISAGWEGQVYDDQPEFDQSLTNLRLRLSRNLSAAFQVSLGAGVEQGDFEQAGADYDDMSIALGVNWQTSRSLVLQFSYDYVNREQDGLGEDYSENRLLLSLAWRHGSPRGSMRGAFADEAE